MLCSKTLERLPAASIATALIVVDGRSLGSVNAAVKGAAADACAAPSDVLNSTRATSPPDTTGCTVIGAPARAAPAICSAVMIGASVSTVKNLIATAPASALPAASTALLTVAV